MGDRLSNISDYVYLCNRARLTWEKVEDLKMEHCYIAPDYVSEARLFQVLMIAFSNPFAYPNLVS